MDSKTIVVNEIYKIGQGGGSVLFLFKELEEVRGR